MSTLNNILKVLLLGKMYSYTKELILVKILLIVT